MAIELENVASGYSTGIINDNFQRIEDYVNENLLNRDGVGAGEDNQMNVSLDMNSNRIYNLPEALMMNEAVPLWQILEIAQGTGIGDNPNYAVVNTSTGEDLLPTTLDKRLVYLSNFDEVLSLVQNRILEGQQIHIRGCPTGRHDDSIYVWEGNNTEAPDGVDILSVNPETPGRFVRRKKAVARSITNLTTPPDNGGEQSSGMTEESPWEELVRRVAKNDASLSQFALPGQRMGSTIFTPTQESLTMGFAPITGSPDTGRSLISLSQIRTMFLDGHVGKALFTPTSLAGNGVASFRYNGRVPLSGVMSGHLRLARRVNATGNGSVDMWLRLSAVSGIPSYDIGQGTGSQLISYSPAYMDSPITPFPTTDGFRDFPTRPTEEMRDALEGEPDINPGSVTGWIGAGQIYVDEGDDGLLPPGYPGSSEGDDLRTTGWFSVEPGDALMLWPLNGTATGLRLQIRSSNPERRWFVQERSSMSESPFIVLIPEQRNIDRSGPPPWEARIYWHRDGDTAEELIVKKVPDPSMVTTPWWGNWVFKEFPVCRDIVFWPGAEYRFSFTSRGYGFVGTGDNYIRVASGGLRFDFDATEIYSELLDLYANNICEE